MTDHDTRAIALAEEVIRRHRELAAAFRAALNWNGFLWLVLGLTNVQAFLHQTDWTRWLSVGWAALCAVLAIGAFSRAASVQKVLDEHGWKLPR